MKLNQSNSNFFIIQDDGRVFKTKHMNLALIYCVNQCNIKPEDVERAFLSMYDNKHDTAHFGRFGGFLFTNNETRNVYGAN